MAGDQRSGSRILGRLRAADGKGVVRIAYQEIAAKENLG
jgi:hypothetical protein